jgi:hypothetical protein
MWMSHPLLCAARTEPVTQLASRLDHLSSASTVTKWGFNFRSCSKLTAKLLLSVSETTMQSLFNAAACKILNESRMRGL